MCNNVQVHVQMYLCMYIVTIVRLKKENYVSKICNRKRGKMLFR